MTNTSIKSCKGCAREFKTGSNLYCFRCRNKEQECVECGKTYRSHSRGRCAGCRPVLDRICVTCRGPFKTKGAHVCPRCRALSTTCQDCGKGITGKSLRCRSCNGVKARKKTVGKVRLKHSGYIEEYTLDRGYIPQHRLVMERSLGRKLLKEETVHHLNGVRSDNRLDNLELWSNSHPAGQRVEDKVKWAEEILDLYKKEGEH